MTEPTSEPRPRSDDAAPSGDAAQPEDAARLDSAQSALGRLATLATADHLEVYTQIADDLAARLASPDVDPAAGSDQSAGSDRAATEPDRRPNA